MAEHVANVRLANEAEREQWLRLRDDPAMDAFAQGGARTAHEDFLPALRAGHYGFTEREIRARMDRHIAAALASADGEAPWTEDERFMWRLGFEAVALPAVEKLTAGDRISAAIIPLSSRGARRGRDPADFGSLPTPKK